MDKSRGEQTHLKTQERSYVRAKLGFAENVTKQKTARERAYIPDINVKQQLSALCKQL